MCWKPFFFLEIRKFHLKGGRHSIDSGTHRCLFIFYDISLTCYSWVQGLNLKNAANLFAYASDYMWYACIVEKVIKAKLFVCLQIDFLLYVRKIRNTWDIAKVSKLDSIAFSTAYVFVCTQTWLI